MQEHRLRDIAMSPRQTPVHNWHAARHRVVHRQHVAHVHQEHVIGVTIRVQRIQHAHQITVQSQLHL